MINILFLLLGLVFLVGGAIITVNTSKKLAKAFGISEIVIGLTVISIGTSLPEIAVNIKTGLAKLAGAAVGTSGIAIGTNIGSCLAQITLILGITGLIVHVKIDKKTLWIDGTAVLIAIIAFFIVARFFGNSNGEFIITQLEGFILILLYIGYLWYTTKVGHIKKKIAEVEGDLRIKTNIPLNILFSVLGIGLLIYGAGLVVSKATILAEQLGVSQAFIGVMIIGVGTALPELTIAIIGVLKKSNGISIGTLIGSNITDPLLSLGSGAVIAGFTVSKSLLFFDIPFWFFATVLALLLIRRNKLTLFRGEALTLILTYGLFVFLKLKFFL